MIKTALIIAITLLSAYLNLNRITVTGFILSTIITSGAISGILYLLIITFRRFAGHNFVKSILMTALTILTLFVILIWYATQGNWYACTEMVVMPEFRTNILTGACEFQIFNAMRSCYGTAPWYYTPDCEISREEKVIIIKNAFSSKYKTSHDILISECGRICRDFPADFCKRKIFNELYCRDIMPCVNAAC